MGIRTFLESEVSKSNLRKDLVEKMVKLDPDEPTKEELRDGITKLR
jgi:1D-myo-inositol-triphosphate 3-kinase